MKGGTEGKGALRAKRGRRRLAQQHCNGRPTPRNPRETACFFPTSHADRWSIWSLSHLRVLGPRLRGIQQPDTPYRFEATLNLESP